MTELQDIIKAVRELEEKSKSSSVGSSQWIAEVENSANVILGAIVAYNTP